MRLYLIFAADFWASGSLFYSSRIALGGKQALGLFGNAKELTTQTDLWTGAIPALPIRYLLGLRPWPSK